MGTHVVKRSLLLAAVVTAAAIPGTAGGANWKGVVIAKDPARKAVVTASPTGVVRTLRAPGKVRALRIGQRLVVRGRALADGTFAARRVRVVGRARAARVRAVVVEHQVKRARLIVSAGGTVFALRWGRVRALAAAQAEILQPGDQIVAQVAVEPGAVPAAEQVQEVGHVDLLELEGIFLEASETTLQLAIVHRGRVDIALPAGTSLPELTAGDEVALVVSVGEDGAFALVAIQTDEGEDADGHGVDLDEEEEEIEVDGVVTSLDPLTVLPGDGATPVVCEAAEGVSLAGVDLGDVVEIECELVDGRFVLAELEVEDDEADAGDEAEHENEADSAEEDGAGENESGNAGPGNGGNDDHEDDEDEDDDEDD